MCTTGYEYGGAAMAQWIAAHRMWMICTMDGAIEPTGVAIDRSKPTTECTLLKRINTNLLSKFE